MNCYALTNPGPGPGNVRKPLKRQKEAGDASLCIWCQSCGFPHQPDGKSTLLPMSLPHQQQASKTILRFIYGVLHNNGPTMLQILNKEVLKRELKAISVLMKHLRNESSQNSADRLELQM